MKKLLAIGLVLSMLLALAACGGDTSTVSSEETNSIVSEAVSSEETSSEEVSSEEPEDPNNVAKGKRVYFSSENYSMLFIGTKAVDGDTDTSWASNTTSEEIDEFIMVDLGQNYNIEEITLDWGNSFATEYTVSVSRGGVEFTEIYSTKEATGGSSQIPAENAVARYVRVNCKKVNSILGTYMGATIKEISVKAGVADDQTLGSEKEAMVITKNVQPTEDDVYVMGRNYAFNELIWAGSVYEYKCTGSIAGAVISASSGQFEVSVDGGEWLLYPVEEQSTKEYIFADDLDPNKEHTVRIMKSQDVWSSRVTVQGVVVEDSADIVKGYTRDDYALKIEFIGDSITSGGVTGQYNTSYVYTCASILNANYNVVSRSGQGLYKHVNFGTPGPLKSLYAGIGTESGDYDYSYNPDLVVLNIGTNDGANVRQLESEAEKKEYREQFEKMYVEMLEILHEKNPNATILCTVGQMGDYNQVFTELQSAIDTFKTNHPDAKVHFFKMSAATDAGKETSWHPGTESHIRNGKELAEEIKKIMNLK